MAGNAITLKKLSSILGVSVSTISKALNDSHEISDATKKRIVELAKLHNYQPNKIALGLKSGITNTIAVVIPSVQNSFFARVLYGIESVISETKYNIVVCLTKESHDKEVSNFKVLSNGVVDGFILSVAQETQSNMEFSHFKEAISRNKPIVMFDRVSDSIDCDKVITDDYEAVKNTTEELISTGRSHIVLASTIPNLSVGIKRKKGYLETISKKGVVSYVVESDNFSLENHLNRLITEHPIDAIIGLDTDASFAALKVSKRAGKKIPEEMAVVGYVSERMAKNLTPELSTINQHSFTIGKTAATMLLNKLKNKSAQNEEVVINSTFTKRATT
jgi:LacI family transcriptional regulator